MHIREICRMGYFDRVIIDGYMLPLYNDLGIEIKESQSIIDAIEENNQTFSQGIARLRLNIAGEATNIDSPLELARMRKHREKDLGLEKCTLGNMDRYYIGYVDIFILKSNNLLPALLEHKGKTYEDVEKISHNDYELMMLLAAIDIQKNLLDENKNLQECNIAIVDKVFVHYNFRRCGISSWIHDNLSDLIKVYGMIDIAAAIMLPGDFNNESKRIFNMTKEEYEQMLIQHYVNVGYKPIQHNIMYKQFLKTKKILGIL